MHGSHASSVSQNRQILQWLAEGRLDLARYVSATFALSDIVKAFEALGNDRFSRC